MKLKQNYDYCIIKDINKIILYDNNVYYNVNSLNDTYLINVKVYKKNDGMLQIEGEQLIWRCATCKTPIDELDDKPISKYIHKFKGCKWLGIKPYEYVLGWYIINRRKKVMFLFSNYNIQVIKNENTY